MGAGVGDGLGDGVGEGVVARAPEDELEPDEVPESPESEEGLVRVIVSEYVVEINPALSIIW